MDFEKICMVFSMQEPYYGILLSAMERVPDPSFKTMAVGRSGNVFKLFYSPDFVEKLDIDTLCQCLKHEVLHIAFNHFSIWDNDPDSEAERYLRNVACDMEVNGYINTSIMRGVNPVLAKNMGWDNFLGTMEYYKRLNNTNQQQQAQANQPTKPCNGGQGGQNGQSNNRQTSQNNSQEASNNNPTPSSSNQSPDSGSSGVSKEITDKCEPFDDHSQWPTGMSNDETEMLKQAIDDMLVFAAEEVEKGRGTIPGELAGRITEIRNRKKPRPVADWKRYFRRYLGNEFSEFIRKSKKRESRRFPDAAGNRHRRKSHILVAIDTSGSVSMPEYREFFGQIRTLTATATFHVVECDTRIQHEYDFKGKPNDALYGGGGTDFQPPVDLFNKNRRLYDALVYFTDGYCDIPKDTPKDTLWVISSKGDQSDRNRYRVNGASVAFIPKQNQ